MKILAIHGVTVAVLAVLTGCGGGGAGGGAGTTPATLSGAATGSVSGTTPLASGTLTVSDPDAGEASFQQPGSLAGKHGNWSVTFSGNTLTWTYTLDNAKAPASATIETLPVLTQDGTSFALRVSIAASGADLVSSVPDAVYTGIYAAEKLAVFNRLNADRARCGFGKLAQNAQLDQAAQGHATYQAGNLVLSHTQEAGIPYFTGITLGDRLSAVGYPYRQGGEIINALTWGSATAGSTSNNSVSVTELSAVNSLLHLYASVYHLVDAMRFNREVGIGIDNASIRQDNSLSLKPLVINSGTRQSSSPQTLDPGAVAVFPCEGTQSLSPVFGNEEPDPYPTVDRDVTPYGQPVFVSSAPGTRITLSSGTITLRGGQAVPTTLLDANNDPQRQLLGHQVFLVPTVRLADNATYDVQLSGTHSGRVSASNPTGAWTLSFSFGTGTKYSER